LYAGVTSPSLPMLLHEAGGARAVWHWTCCPDDSGADALFRGWSTAPLTRIEEIVMADNRRTYTGVADMAETAAGGLEPSEHQGRLPPDVPCAESTPAERSVPPSGSEYVAPDVGVTAPGSGTL